MMTSAITSTDHPEDRWRARHQHHRLFQPVPKDRGIWVMTPDRLMIEVPVEPHWQDSFVELFGLCRANAGEEVVILAESQSRRLNLHLAQAALAAMSVPATTITVPSKPAPPVGHPVDRRVECMTGEDAVLAKLQAADLVIDLTVEGLMHAPQTGTILKDGTRIMTVSNEHPDILARLRPDPAMKDMVKAAVAACRAASTMTVTSAAGTDLTVAMADATVGVWGWTDRPGTLATGRADWLASRAWLPTARLSLPPATST